MRYRLKSEKFYITPRLAQLIKIYSIGRSLDAGCGTGEYFKYFNSSELHGIDITSSYLNKINKIKGKKIILKKADVKNIPYPDKYFDFVFSAAVLEYLKDKREIEKSIAELKRVLKPNGVLVIGVPHENKFTQFVRQRIIGRFLEQTADDPYFIMGNPIAAKELKKLGFKIKGCLGWVTWKNLNNEVLAKLIDNLFWIVPFFSGSLIGIYEKK